MQTKRKTGKRYLELSRKDFRYQGHPFFATVKRTEILRQRRNCGAPFSLVVDNSDYTDTLPVVNRSGAGGGKRGIRGEKQKLKKCAP